MGRRTGPIWSVRPRSGRRRCDSAARSASALSEAVRRLQTHLDVRLLHRTTRSLRPNEAAQRLLEHWKPALRLSRTRSRCSSVPASSALASPRHPLFLCDPGRRLMPASLRAFVDFIRDLPSA
ncbi:LysR family transcriptional regulator [Variovorax ginsengisoli]|uniref:LysR family transcriptional regulator n=1 Tax=Variovorax guangxiensis TaxID=1775474 RepID=A0A502E0S8_9BURK|nr:LysR family transcriptional regulator [Variovorax ginsengisoli]TPG30322.1 LysR family transcriptional regulator [Variovorax guangxiensis]